MRAFVRWAARPPAKAGNLEILEQRLPGEPEPSEEESERRGLPDAWIHDGESWSLLIESKVSAKLTANQLLRHLRTAERRGFDDVRVLVLAVEEPRRLPARCHFRSWTDVYAWLKRHQATSSWALRAARYMEVVETRWSSNGYLKEGALTKFTGIPFDADNPWNYPEAKRLVRLALDELSTRKSLQRQIGMDPDGQRRPAITGSRANLVWDFLPLRAARDEKQFTRCVHLTMVVTEEHVVVCATVPNGLRPKYRKGLLGHGKDRFMEIMRAVTEEFDRRFSGVAGAYPWAELLQRRYPTQRSEPIMDSKLILDLHTAFTSKGGSNREKRPVKLQPLWLDMVYELLRQKKGNLQITVGASFKMGQCELLKSPRALDQFENAWLSCRPLIEATVGVPKR